MNQILFQLSDKLFIRDPLNTEVGRAIISTSVRLIDDIGFDKVTFRKIAEEVKSTETTVYRYFENKFRLLQYLTDWYWACLNFQIHYHVNNITDPEEKLKICLQLLAGTKEQINISPIDHPALHRIVIAEFEKAYLYPSIDRDYNDGLLDPFTDTCKAIADIVREVNPEYPFPHSLVSTAISAASRQIWFSRHMPLLSDLKKDQKTMNERLYQFLEGFVLTTIKGG